MAVGASTRVVRKKYGAGVYIYQAKLKYIGVCGCPEYGFVGRGGGGKEGIGWVGRCELGGIS